MIDARPMNRSCPSLSSMSLAKLSRHNRGASNGSSPSTTSPSAKAAHSESGTAFPLRVAATALLRCLRARTALVLHVTEELGARIEHHHVALAAERRFVRLEAAIERVELGVGAIRLRVDRRGLRVAVALGLLRGLVRVGKDHDALAISIGADLFGFRLAERAKLVRHASALGLHARVDRAGHIRRKLDAAEPHIDD